MATPVQKSRVELILEAVTKGLERIDTVAKKVDEVSKAQERSIKRTERATVANRGFSAGIGRMVKQMVALLAVYASISSVQATLRPAIEMEGFQTEFSVLLGSLDAAKTRINELSQFAAGTPFEMPQIVAASRTLETLTKGALATGEGLRMVGDVSAGTGQPIEELAVWFGRLYDGIQSGRPVGEAMMRLQELGAITGDTRARIEAMQKAGVDGNQIWAELSASFSNFSGLMEAKSQTLGGQLSNLSDNFYNLRAQFGEGIRDALTPILTQFNQGLGEIFSSGRWAEYGQRIGAYLTLAFERFQDGTIADLIRLTWQAAMEQGIAYSRGLMSDFFEWLGEDGWKHLLVGLASIAQSIQELWLEIMRPVFDFMRAGFSYVMEGFMAGWDVIKNLGITVFTAIANGGIDKFEGLLNFLAKGFEGLVNSYISGLNVALGLFGKEIDLINIDPITLSRLEAVTGEVRKTATWAEHWNAAQEANAGLQDTMVIAMRQQLNALRDLVGLQNEGNADALTAWQQLNLLLDEIQMKQAGIASTSVVPSGNGRSGDQETDAPNSNDPKSWDQALVEAETKFLKLHSIGEQIGSVFDATFRGISASIKQVTGDTEYWQSKLGLIPGTIVGSIINAFAEMAAAWVTKQAVMLAATLTRDRAEEGSWLAKNAVKLASDVATGIASFLAWLPAMIAQSVVSYGGAVIAGLAAMALVFSAFEQGGRVGGGEQLIRVNEGGKSEYVVSGRSPADNDYYLNYANAGGRIADLIDARAPVATGIGSGDGTGPAGGYEGIGDQKVVIYWGGQEGAEHEAAKYSGRVELRRMVQEEIQRWRS